VKVRSKAVASVVLSVALLATACGARLTDAQRAAGIGALARGGTTGGTGPTTPGTTFGSTGPSVGPSSSTGLGGGPSTGLGGPGLGGAACTSGGATDTGVTANSITLATIADVSGVQPGLFKSAWQAMQALQMYVNSNGGICGRQIKNLLLDSKADATQNRAAVEQACTSAFASVGSMSAFDDGGASVGQSCGIPDISAITVNAARSTASNVYPAYPVGPNYFNTAWGTYIKNTYPNAIKHAGFITLNAGASIQNGNQRIKALTNLGYNFVYKAQVQVLEANYTPFVENMKKAGVQLIDMVSDYQSTVRLQRAMEQQGWFPEVRLWDSAVYSQKYLTEGGTAVQSNNSSACSVTPKPCPMLLFLDTAMIEEASSNPEMQLYLTWLQRAAPGALPDYFGIYAWSAGRLFLKAAQAVGGKLTRTALFTELKSIHSWSDFGMHVAHDIGAKKEANCALFAEVKNGKFVRVSPASGWTCVGSLMRT
jgi:ABC-type branched-subunit amino acid transport system substrate-binding protein